MQMQTRKSQQGFTIIELVVVILLLGILAATALPRFIDVTEQAHDAVFSGVSGSLVTGTALYRAEWVARGQQGTNVPLASYGGLLPAPGFVSDDANYTAETVADPSEYNDAAVTAFSGRASGYPYATAAVATLAAYDADNCAEVFAGLLQTGAPTTNAAGALGDPANAAAIRTAVSTAQTNSAADFQVFTQNVLLDTGFPENAAGGTPANALGEARNHQQPAPACIYAYSAEPENFNRFVLYAPWNGRTEVFTSAADLYTAINRFEGAAVTP